MGRNLEQKKKEMKLKVLSKVPAFFQLVLVSIKLFRGQFIDFINLYLVDFLLNISNLLCKRYKTIPSLFPTSGLVLNTSQYDYIQ